LTMDRLKVWLVTIGEILPLEKSCRRMRTAMLAERLAARGHDVVWWTSAFDHFRKDWLFGTDAEVPVSDRLKLRALKGTGYRKNVSLRRIMDHRFIASKFRKKAREAERPDVVVVSMPPHDLAFEAVAFAKENNIPVLVDVRDKWPDIFLDAVPDSLRAAVRLAMHRDFRMIEAAMRRANGLLAPTEAFLQWGLGYAQRERGWKDRVLPIGYMRHKGTPYAGRLTGLFGPMKDKFIVSFVGAVTERYHNPMIMIEAARALSSHKDIHFVIAGDGELFGALKEASRDLDNVTLTGWLDQDEISFVLERSMVGICPSAKPVDLPTNKTFSYLSEGLPVVSSFDGDLKRLIENRRIGFNYRSGDIDMFAGYIKRLYDDPVLYAEMSLNALMTFDALFDAEKIYDEYARHIEKVAHEMSEPDWGKDLF
jgi:glycosyltransferase involved in cell wall biosynthesis